MLTDRTGNLLRILPAGPLVGSVELPGSKSVANRALVCAALADGTSTLRRVGDARDIAVMADGLRALGIRIEQPEPHTLIVHGCGGFIPAEMATIDAADAGTAMRFLTALAALGYGHYHLDGSARMRQRPIGQLVDALRSLGAGIGYARDEGFPPLDVVSRGLTGGRVRFDKPASSQFVSAVLMVAPYAAQDVMVRVDGGLPSRPYVEMTIRIMRRFGVETVAGELDRFVVPAHQRYEARELTIEPDASAATYFWAAAAITGGSVEVRGLSRESLQGDVGFVDVLAEMGCAVEETPAGLRVRRDPARPLRGIDVDLGDMPDTVQTLAAVALFAEGPTVIRNVANLAIKETDRLTALERELSKLGARVQRLDGGLRIEPPAHILPAIIETYNDHRMAMSFATAGLGVAGIVLRDPDCVAKSFPRFFETLETLQPANPTENQR